MEKNTTIQYIKHLFRIRYSLFLMPVFWFAYAVSQTSHSSLYNTVLLFLIIHIIVHPSTFAYNRFLAAERNKTFDNYKFKNLKNKILLSICFIDLIGIVLAFFISIKLMILITIYLLISKLYGYLVINKGNFNLYRFTIGGIIQGSFLFIIIQTGIAVETTEMLSKINLTFASLCTLFIIGTYPVTHLHNLNKHRNIDQEVNTKISVWSSILFSGKSFLIASKILGIILFTSHHLFYYEVYIFCIIPLILFFGFWLIKVNKSFKNIDYKSTLQLNYVSAFALSFAFILMIVLK